MTLALPQGGERCRRLIQPLRPLCPNPTSRGGWAGGGLPSGPSVHRCLPTQDFSLQMPPNPRAPHPALRQRRVAVSLWFPLVGTRCAWTYSHSPCGFWETQGTRDDPPGLEGFLEETALQLW